MSEVLIEDNLATEAVYSAEMTDQELEKILNKIGHKISEAVKERPTVTAASTDKLTPLQKGLGLAVSLIVIIGAAWAGLDYVVSSAITKALGATSTDLATLKTQGVDLRRDVDRLLDRSAQNIIKNPAAPPADLKDAANHLQQRKIEVPLQEVVATGKTLLATGQSNPEQWQAFLAFVSYRSFLNGPGDMQATTVSHDPTAYSIQTPPGKTSGELRAANQGVPIEQAARIEEIGKNLNEKVKTGPPVLFVIGGAILLDNQLLRHVQLQNVEVHWSNNHVILDDVVFINCSFVFDNTDPSKKLGETILSSARVTFNSGVS